ncbi:hypothetical protein [Insolitispirillum peregrinum]|uniref:hypothetical protein n=1 Tax=Insolitispirillum peregrinum TaxID=80876 RepID=UPI00361A3B46
MPTPTEVTDSQGQVAPQASSLFANTWDLRFKIGVSRRYSSRLEGHYSSLDNVSTVAVLVGGSTALADVIGKGTSIAVYATLVVVVLTSLSLAFRWGDKARLHGGLYRQYTRLQERLDRAGGHLTEETFNEIKADYVMVEAEEPTIRTALIAICHNEEVEAQGHPKTEKISLRFWQRWFARFGTLPPYTWEK